MTYLIGQIAVFLLLALALGLLVGWLLRGLVAARSQAQPANPRPESIETEDSAETNVWP